MADENDLKNLPPQNIEAEQMVLGAVLYDDRSIDEIKDLVGPGDFYRTGHGKIFAAMLAMREREERIDLITLADFLRRGDVLEKLKEQVGESYLSYLVSQVPTAAGIRAHAAIVASTKQLRDVLHICGEAQARAYQRDEPAELITGLIAQLNAARRNEGSELITQRELINYGYGETEKRYEQKSRISGIPTGFRGLDELLDGLQNGDLILVGGRPSMGKSAFAECIARNVACHFLTQAEAGAEKHAVGFISLEMGKRQLAIRALSGASGVPNTRIRRGELSAGDWDELSRGAGDSIGLPIIYETAAMSDIAVERTIDTLVQRHGCRLMLVDYLQLMMSHGHKDRTREQEVSNFSRMLKRKAKQHGIPVVALAQLNRLLENRVDKRPGLADLRESGSLEQDADVIAFLYREEVYKPCSCPPQMDCICNRRGRAQVLVRKQRMGPCGDVELWWNGKTTNFRDMA